MYHRKSSSPASAGSTSGSSVSPHRRHPAMSDEENINMNSTSTAMKVQEGEKEEDFASLLVNGLSTDQATQQREVDGHFNVVKPPVDCPAWACMLLPCIKHIPSMKAFASISPEDAEVLRNGQWRRYDAASLVTGDVIRLEEGDTIPADCRLVQLGYDDDDNNNNGGGGSNGDSNEECLIDLRPITGEEHLRSIPPSAFSKDAKKPTRREDGIVLYMGGKMIQGSGKAVITAIGSKTLLAKLIREKRFPPTEPILEVQHSSSSGDSDTEGIALHSMV